jgi:hypothetical protein
MLEKTVKSEEGKRKYPRRCHVCATHKKRSETRYILSSAWCRSTKGRSLGKCYLKI